MTKPSWQDYGTYDESAYPHLWDGVIAAWCPSLGPTGDRLHNLSRYNNWGTLSNMDPATDWVVSGGQYALDFDGASDNVSFSTITFSGPFSVSLWCLKRTNGSANEREVIGNTTDGNVFIGFTSTTTLVSGSTSGTKTFSGAITNNTVNHLLVTRDGGNTARVFINGRESSTGGLSMTGNMPINVLGQYLNGTGGNAPFSWDGWIDDVPFYNRALSAGEAQQLYLLGRAGMYERRRRTARRAVIEQAGFRAYWARRQNQIIGGGV